MTIPLSKKKMAFRSAILVFAIVLCINVIYQNEISSIVMALVWIGLFLCAAGLVYLIAKLADKNAGVIINDKGVVNNSGFRSSGLIKWENIIQIEMMQHGSNSKKSLVIEYTTNGRKTYSTISLAMLKNKLRPAHGTIAERNG